MKSDIKRFKMVARQRRLEQEALCGRPRAKVIETRKSVKQSRKKFKQNRNREE